MNGRSFYPLVLIWGNLRCGCAWGLSPSTIPQHIESLTKFALLSSCFHRQLPAWSILLLLGSLFMLFLVALSLFFSLFYFFNHFLNRFYYWSKQIFTVDLLTATLTHSTRKIRLNNVSIINLPWLYLRRSCLSRCTKIKSLPWVFRNSFIYSYTS